MSCNKSCNYCGAKANSPCTGYRLQDNELHSCRTDTRSSLEAAAPALLAACERVLERWETHDGQMNHVDDIRAAVAAAKAGGQ
jgi:hypothetical protein